MSKKTYKEYLKNKEIAKKKKEYKWECTIITHWFTKWELKQFLKELKNFPDNELLAIPLIKARIEEKRIEFPDKQHVIILKNKRDCF
jgi:hypothetical protein